jgi:hypothetical protein
MACLRRSGFGQAKRLLDEQFLLGQTLQRAGTDTLFNTYTSLLRFFYLVFLPEAST